MRSYLAGVAAWSSTAGKLRQEMIVATDQGLFLGTRPALDLALKQKRLVPARHFLAKDEPDRTVDSRVTTIGSLFMLANPLFEVFAGPGIVGAVATLEDIDKWHSDYVFASWQTYSFCDDRTGHNPEAEAIQHLRQKHPSILSLRQPSILRSLEGCGQSCTKPAS
jgi:hypothetical protein